MGLEFYDQGHVYMLDGQRLPCVSDLCRFLHREIYENAPLWQMEAAADRGTKVHAATEALDRSGRAEIEDEYLPYLRAYAAFRKEHDVQWELIEHPDYHPAHRFAGTIDRYGMVDGVRTLMDIKTTYTVHRPLCNASLNLYRMLLENRGWAVERLDILHLKKDGSYERIRFERDDTVPLALITLHTAMQRRKRGEKHE